MFRKLGQGLLIKYELVKGTMITNSLTYVRTVCHLFRHVSKTSNLLAHIIYVSISSEVLLWAKINSKKEDQSLGFPDPFF